MASYCECRTPPAVAPLKPGSFFRFLYLYTLPPCSPAQMKKESVAFGVGWGGGIPPILTSGIKLQVLSMAKCWWREEWKTRGELLLQLPHVLSLVLLTPRPLSVHRLMPSPQHGLSEGSWVSEALKLGFYLPSRLPERGCCLTSGPAGNFLCGSCWF